MKVKLKLLQLLDSGQDQRTAPSGQRSPDPSIGSSVRGNKTAPLLHLHHVLYLCLHGSMIFIWKCVFQARNYFLRIQMFLWMPVPSGFHLSHRVGHGASLYIQICSLCSNKLLDKLESTQPSVISLRQHFITVALITAQNVSDSEFSLEKKKPNSHPCSLNYTGLFLSSTYQGPS